MKNFQRALVVRRKRKPLVYRPPPNVSTSVQRYGVGSTISRLNLLVNWSSSTESFFPIRSFFSENEFIELSLRYSYFKILCVKVTFPPSGSNYIDGMFYFKMIWSYLVEDNVDITKDDNAKLVPVWQTRNLTYRFYPPRVNITTDGSVVNYSEFLPTSAPINEGYPRFVFYPFINGQSITKHFFIELDLVFRGSRCTSPSVLVDKILNTCSLETMEAIKDKLMKKIEQKKKDDEDEELIGDEENIIKKVNLKLNNNDPLKMLELNKEIIKNEIKEEVKKEDLEIDLKREKKRKRNKKDRERKKRKIQEMKAKIEDQKKKLEEIENSKYTEEEDDISIDNLFN